VQKKNKKIHTTNTPVKKIIKFVAKIIVTKVEPASSSKIHRKTNNKIFELLVFHRIFFRSDNARSLPFVKNTEKTNKYLRSNLQNIRE